LEPCDDEIFYSGGGAIKYVYDAAGNKLRKAVTLSSGRGFHHMTTTTYLAGNVYESSQTVDYAGVPQVGPAAYVERLQFISHEEGRFFPIRLYGEGSPGQYTRSAHR
jgi:hypothetical protein